MTSQGLILVLCALGVATLAKSGEHIFGSLAACKNEGEEVSVAAIKDMGCFTCTCKNGFVECERPHCPSQQGCYMLLESRKDGCCQLCKGCLHRGINHASGTEWLDPDNPCRVMTCKAGVVTESNVQCYTPCRNPSPPAPGQCCPTCRGCRINGQKVTEDRDVTTPEDPCLKCRCERDQLTCSKRACPVLECPASKTVRAPGDCCATCSGSRSLMEPPEGRCLLANKLHRAGESFNIDRCTSCTCLNATSVCQRKACPVLECHRERQTTAPGDCCPHCPAVEESRTQCTIGGQTYEDGETWKLDSCKSCKCYQGQPRCAMTMCPRQNLPCPPNTKLVHWPGECCPRCVEGDGVCTVFGDPHYRTFDGKFYSFQGSCKYQLTADCVGRSFSIRVTNDARSTKTSSWTKTVSIKMGDTKINLGQKMRVKINGIRVDPPHRSIDGKVWVNKTDDGVLIHTHIGIKVLWDGNSFLEVSAPTAYKGRLCGLCGNFNSASRDDWTTRRGRLVLDPDKFGTSWRVGGKKACARPREELSSEMQCYHQKHRRPRDLRRCKPLRGQVFNPCHKKVNSDKYFDSCIEDMCECPSGRCFCESFTAYAHECQRLGVKMADWRQTTGCPSPWASVSGRRPPPPPLPRLH